MALAKVGGLETLFRVFPKILTAPSVCEETVTAGHRIEALDAGLLESRYETKDLEVAAPSLPTLPVPRALGRGDRVSEMRRR